MVESAAEFRKNSFSDEDSATLAKVSALYQNVADDAVSAGDSASFIISQIKAFNIEADNAIDIVNAVNAVSNNFAVSSSDISSALTKTSSAMSVLGNDFQHTIGLVTAGTEIMTGQAGKVARGLRTIGNRFADAAQQADSIEYSVGGVTKSLSLLDETTGDIKSTFDIFQGLKSDWDAMTNSEKQALAIAYAGQTQFEVFSAVMNNFQTAVDATSTAFDSAGSAMQENQKYMDSVAAKENQLKAEFEDFSNRVLSKELVTGFLNAGQAALSFANNDVGAAIVRVAGLSAGAFALVGILGQVAKSIKDVMSAATSIGSLTTTIGQIAAVVGLVVAAVTAVVEIVRAIREEIEKHSYEYLIDQYHQLSEAADELAQKLETAKQKLDELNQTQVADRGSAWQEENNLLQQQIEGYEYLLRLKREQAEMARAEAFEADVKTDITPVLYGSITTTKNQHSDVANQRNMDKVFGFAELASYRSDAWMALHPELGDETTKLTTEQLSALTQSYDTTREALDSLKSAFTELFMDEELQLEMTEALETGDLDTYYDLVEKRLKKVGIELDNNKMSADEYMQSQAKNLNTMALQLKDVIITSGTLTKAQQEEIDGYISTNKERYEYVKSLTSQNEAQKQFATGYENFARNIAQYNVSNGLMSVGEAAQYLANSLGLPIDSAIQLVNNLDGIDSSVKVSKIDFEEAADGTITYKDALYYLNNAFSEIESRGRLSVNTLEAIGEQFSDVDGIENYIDALSKTDLTADEFRNTLAELLDAKVNQIAETGNMTDADSQLINSLISVIGQTDRAKSALLALKDSAFASGNGLQYVRLYANMLSGMGLDTSGILAGLNSIAVGAYETLEALNRLQALERWSTKYRETSPGSGIWVPIRYSTTGPGGGGGGTTTPTGSGGGGTKTDKELERLKDIVSLRESELDLMEKQDKPYDERIRKIKEIQDALHDQAQYMRSIGASQEEINKLSSKWWSLQKDINNLLKEAAEAAKDALQKQADDIESAFAYAIKMAQKEMDAINEKYDKQLDDIEKANDELQKQITLEEKLKAIAEAKSKKLYVYKDGRFQYVDDIDAINEAQSDYEEFLREKNIESQKEQIEADRKAELAIWEQWVTNWQNVTDSYKDAQDRLLAEQVLGISFEASNWAQRLGNAEDFKIKYAAIMAEIAELQKQIDSAGGVSYDPNVDYSALMEKATSKEEFEYLAAMRDAKAKDMGVDYKQAGYRTNEQIRKEKGFAKGTLNAPAGLSLVGEEGPELRVLQKGDAIFPADMTKNLWEWGKIPPSAFKLSNIWGGGETKQQYIFNIDNLSLPDVTDAPSLLSGLKRMAYQRAFGRA